MAIEKIFVWITAAVFLVYGILFSFYPASFANIVTGSIPATSTGLIDMRATYGGMSIAIGLLMFYLANNPKTLRIGMVSVIIVLLCMALTRTLGIIIDGNPSRIMYSYLTAELVPSIIALALYRRMGNNV